MISQILIYCLVLIEVLGTVSLFGFLIREKTSKRVLPSIYGTASLAYLGLGLFSFAMMTVFVSLTKLLFVLSILSLMISAGYGWLIAKE